MAGKGKDLRPKIVLESTAGTGYRYITEKSRRNSPDRIVLHRYDPIIRRHVDFKETR
jgi:large subunit ribosomal protein L33